MKIKESLPKSIKFIRKKYTKKIDTGIILGTGLNKLASIFTSECEIPYKEIPHFKHSTAPSHSGVLILGNYYGNNVAILQGRLHCYEGYSVKEVTYPIYLLKKLGVKNLIITNAAGSLNQNFQPGDLVLISDHLNLTGKIL